jgi:hypothetical protein
MRAKDRRITVKLWRARTTERARTVADYAGAERLPGKVGSRVPCRGSTPEEDIVPLDPPFASIHAVRPLSLLVGRIASAVIDPVEA